MSRNNKILVMFAGGALLVILLILGGVFLFAKLHTGQSGTATDGSTSPFAPFGQGSGDTSQNGSTASSSPTLPTHLPGGATVPLLRKLSDGPVSAVVTGSIVEKVEGRVISYARFLDRGTAHVYEIPLADMIPAHKVSNTTVPRIQEAAWSANGSYVFLRYYDEPMENVATYLAKLTATSTNAAVEFHLEDTTSASTTLEGAFLEDNILDIVFSPDGKSLFYLIRTDAGARGYIRSIEKKTNKLVFSSPLNELTPTWDNNDIILLSTKPSAAVPGYVFMLNLKTGVLDTTLTEVNGVTARMNPSGDRVLFFSIQDGVALLNQLNLTTKAVSPLNLTTLPEKCVWSKREYAIVYCAVPALVPGKNYPDIWYRGEVSYADSIWRLNLETGTQDLIVVPNKLVGESMDAVQLTLSPEEDFLLFIDRNDGALWSAKLREPITSITTSTSTSTPTTTTTTTQ